MAEQSIEDFFQTPLSYTCHVREIVPGKDYKVIEFVTINNTNVKFYTENCTLASLELDIIKGVMFDSTIIPYTKIYLYKKIYSDTYLRIELNPNTLKTIPETGIIEEE